MMRTAAATMEEATVRQHSKQLRLPTIAAQFRRMAEEAVREKQTHVRYLEALLQAEVEERERHAVERRLHEARLPRVKTLEEFDFSQAPQISATQIRELAEGGYLERCEPVLFLGECGTGKTHLMTALCVAACRQRKRVRFTTAAGLVNELVEARQQGQLSRVLGRWTRHEVLALDEIGYVPLADVGAELLFRELSASMRDSG